MGVLVFVLFMLHCEVREVVRFEAEIVPVFIIFRPRNRDQGVGETGVRKRCEVLPLSQGQAPGVLTESVR